ncbi:uncharacterized protein C8Q71DRAFT_746514 [Rhodofomes roseus]|uniref:Uncharacterized protein n=1 Tax=Rhodofomes roseus TaxID=34475 RepID=A0A4Y9Y7W2_9APHY|nr:uncharacterized protein C8Q71DRAFT_746514 [Rhodofomes roseus]KAH9840258.1 hypothetical protein C8Q71DRAFT_746514 [Rhodofomes roseus]TFY57873.1 hypothetical protein EVJ58_g6759 [Rhodofomes roseus]
MSDEQESAPHLSLPAPEPQYSQDATKVPIGSEQGAKFDALGPLVVNSDGTLSRIANWPNMTEIERERTKRILIARNQIRIANQKEKEQEAGPGSTS